MSSVPSHSQSVTFSPLTKQDTIAVCSMSQERIGFVTNILCAVVVCLFIFLFLNNEYVVSVSSSHRHRPMFGLSSCVLEMPLHNAKVLDTYMRNNAFVLIYLYTSWDSDSLRYKSSIERLACRIHDQRMKLVAFNCWNVRTFCSQYVDEMAHYPYLFALSRRNKPVRFRLNFCDHHLSLFIQSLITPLRRIQSKQELSQLRINHFSVVIGYVNFSNDSTISSAYRFYSSYQQMALQSAGLCQPEVLVWAVVTGPAELAAHLGLFLSNSLIVYTWNSSHVWKASMSEKDWRAGIWTFVLSHALLDPNTWFSSTLSHNELQSDSRSRPSFLLFLLIDASASNLTEIIQLARYAALLVNDYNHTTLSTKLFRHLQTIYSYGSHDDTCSHSECIGCLNQSSLPATSSRRVLFVISDRARFAAKFQRAGFRNSANSSVVLLNFNTDTVITWDESLSLLLLLGAVCNATSAQVSSQSLSAFSAPTCQNYGLLGEAPRREGDGHSEALKFGHEAPSSDRLSSQQLVHSLVHTNRIHLVFFYTSACGHCTSMYHVLLTVAHLLRRWRHRIVTVRVNIESDRYLSRSFSVVRVPAFIVFNPPVMLNRNKQATRAVITYRRMLRAADFSHWVTQPAQHLLQFALRSSCILSQRVPPECEEVAGRRQRPHLLRACRESLRRKCLRRRRRSHILDHYTPPAYTVH